MTEPNLTDPVTTVRVDVYAPSGAKSGAVDLPASVFDARANVSLLHQVVVAQQAAARQGTHATKTRGEVSGGGIKPWRQKGTGRARQGSRRAPQWTGGGVVHGPQPRSYAQRTPKKMIAAALRAALSDRARDGRLFVLEQVIDAAVPSTKQALAALTAVLGDCASAVVVLDRSEETAWMSLRNVAYLHPIAVDQLNTYDVLACQGVVFTRAALAGFLARQGVDLEAAVATDEEDAK
ncbi:MAG: 50S ribosomal protein L4 [Propionibacteriaceae bacterium]|jgi:large subunit ribosomal protein L4|nr:50S ribosomal protein L4 [Propionibacteriaceae bacterium]